jgi:hypothetical protein
VSAADPVTIASFIRSEGTDPAVSNLIAFTIIEAWRAYYGDEWVPFSLRYSIANELQRRLAAQEPEAVEWMVITTVATGPTAGRTIGTGPTDEETARFIAADPDPNFTRTLHRRAAAGAWVPVQPNRSE